MEGVAFKQHLLYKLVSVECCGGIEQQFSILVLTLNPAPQSQDDCFLSLSFWHPQVQPWLMSRLKTSRALVLRTTGIKLERAKIVWILYLSVSNIIQIYTHVLLLYGVTLPFLPRVGHCNINTSLRASPVHSLDRLSFYLDMCTWEKSTKDLLVRAQRTWFSNWGIINETCICDMMCLCFLITTHEKIL